MLYNYTDQVGVTHVTHDYPGDSFRARVINRAYRNHQFRWVTVPEIGIIMPLFMCCQCKNWHTSSGVAGDHIDPQQWGGSNEPYNLQILCNPCNSADLHHRGTGPVSSRTRSTFRHRDYLRSDDSDLDWFSGVHHP
jgi:hypothetical protein